MHSEQERIWQFIVLYNQHFSASLRFLKISHDDEYRHGAIERALNSGHSELVEQARKLGGAMMTFSPEKTVSLVRENCSA